MGLFLVYILKSSVCLTLFYLFYRLLLSRETFYRFNRIALLGLIVLSVILPFCTATIKQPDILQRSVLDMETLLLMATTEATGIASTVSPFWIRLLLFIYVGGVALFFFRLLYCFGRMFRIIRTGKKTQLENNIYLIIIEKPIVIFSWMKYIVVSKKDMDENRQEILTHEMAHIKSGHSIDLLLSEICILFQWFNPAVWLFKQELQNIHEYEADEAVLTQGIDAKKYQLLLIKKAVGSQRFISMANSFNHSTLKKRITMMLKEKSNPWARLKYLYVLPLAAIAVTAFARPEISSELEKISTVKISEIIPVKDVVEIKNSDTLNVAMEPEATLELLKVKEEECRRAFEKAIHEEATGEREQTEIQQEMEERQKELERKALNEDRLQNNNLSSILSGLNSPLLFVNGKKQPYADLAGIDPLNIEMVNVMKGEKAIELYGEEGKNGIIEVTLRKTGVYPDNAIIYIDGVLSTKEEMDALASVKIQEVQIYKGTDNEEKYGSEAIGKNIIDIKTRK